MQSQDCSPHYTSWKKFIEFWLFRDQKVQKVQTYLLNYIYIIKLYFEPDKQPNIYLKLISLQLVSSITNWILGFFFWKYINDMKTSLTTYDTLSADKSCFDNRKCSYTVERCHYQSAFLHCAHFKLNFTKKIQWKISYVHLKSSDIIYCVIRSIHQSSIRKGKKTLMYFFQESSIAWTFHVIIIFVTRWKGSAAQRIKIKAKEPLCMHHLRFPSEHPACVLEFKSSSYTETSSAKSLYGPLMKHSTKDWPLHDMRAFPALIKWPNPKIRLQLCLLIWTCKT